jgi:hypothetical protein
MSSQPDLLEIEEIPDVGNSGCSSKAKVIVKAKKESPNIIWIVATDKGIFEFHKSYYDI